MSETESFTSLLALIDNHLSKTSIQGSQSEENNGTFAIQVPSLREGHSGTQSETILLPTVQRFPIPSLSLSESPIKNVLAEQVANMLKAKEKRLKEEEKRKEEEDMKKLSIQDEDDDGSNCVIDLMQAIKTPYRPGPFVVKEKLLSSSSSLESLFEPKFIDCDDEFAKKKALTPEPLLPCTTDMSYILKQKVDKAKCSDFGKVLISRYRPVAAPYFKSRVKNDIVRFNFQTKSPCDLIKEHLRKPSSYNTYQFDLAPELRL